MKVTRLQAYDVKGITGAAMRWRADTKLAREFWSKPETKAQEKDVLSWFVSYVLQSVTFLLLYVDSFGVNPWMNSMLTWMERHLGFSLLLLPQFWFFVGVFILMVANLFLLVYSVYRMLQEGFDHDRKFQKYLIERSNDEIEL